MYEEEHGLNRLEREEVVPKYKFTSLPYYQRTMRMKSLNKELKILNLWCYVVEQEVRTQGIRMSRGVESIFVTKQGIVVLPKAKPTIIEGVLVAVRVRYSEPKHNQ